jgi:hypothetical protein
MLKIEANYFARFRTHLAPLIASAAPVAGKNIIPPIHDVAARPIIGQVTMDSDTLAAAHYVDLNSTNATSLYTSWAAAATNIKAWPFPGVRR